MLGAIFVRGSAICTPHGLGLFRYGVLCSFTEIILPLR